MERILRIPLRPGYSRITPMVHPLPSFHARTFLLALMLILLGSSTAFAQGGEGRFKVNGRLKIDGGDLAGARVVVYRNGAKERTITVDLNRFSLELALNSNYVLSFEKDGFVAKKLQFDTKLPASATARVYAPFEFAVSLFKQYDDLNIVVFNQPVGKIRYEPSLEDFDYDTDYTKSIQSQLQQAMAEVEKKQKEEARQAAADAKQQAIDAKAQAKAEADAKKLAEANEKAELEAKRSAEANAKAELEAKKLAEAKAKAELEAKRQADANAQAEEQRKAQLRQDEEEKARIAREQAERLAEEQRKAAQPKPAAQAVAPAPKPKPVVAAAPKPTPPAPNVSPNTSRATAHEDAEQRRSSAPVLVVEESRMAKAKPVVVTEDARFPERIAAAPVRNEELIIEPNKVMTVIKLEQGLSTMEYRKVTHKWGGTFYFKNGEACTQQIYEVEALSGREQEDDRLVGMPSGR